MNIDDILNAGIDIHDVDPQEVIRLITEGQPQNRYKGHFV